ncbi:MAG TPA: hypothetical protein VFW13_01805 [Phenylobacterium sp.]|nr:hypothetical protein [Phenylobacterium sp.]
MSPPTFPKDPVEAAIERGAKTAALLVGARDKLFEPMAAIMLIAGPDGLRACAAGVVEAVIQGHRNIAADEAQR